MANKDKTEVKTKINTPGYISALLQPVPGQSADRRVWSIPLAGVWVPFFTATNTAGETALPAEVLGAPLRLQRNKDGEPRFTQSGRPVIRVVRELSEQIRMVRDNFMAGLLSYAETVRKGMPAEYKAQVEAALRAGAPITEKDALDLQEFLAAQAPAEPGNGAEAPAEPMYEAEKVLVPA